MVGRGEICHCRHCQRQCKIFASAVNFSIFAHFFVFLSPKLLKFGEIKGVKFLTNLMSGAVLMLVEKKRWSSSAATRGSTGWVVAPVTILATLAPWKPPRPPGGRGDHTGATNLMPPSPCAPPPMPTTSPSDSSPATRLQTNTYWGGYPQQFLLELNYWKDPHS